MPIANVAVPSCIKHVAPLKARAAERVESTCNGPWAVVVVVVVVVGGVAVAVVAAVVVVVGGGGGGAAAAALPL